MDDFRIYCLFTKGALTQDVSDLLFATAQKMLALNKGKMRIKAAICNGIVTTDFKPVFLNSWVSGYQFDAELECDGDTKIRFIAKKIDTDPGLLLDGVVLPGSPVTKQADSRWN